MFDFDPYQLSWVLLSAGALTVSLVIYYWLISRFTKVTGFFYSAVLCLFLLVPAPVPNYENFYAPAYVVYIFETFFQIKGAPALSGQILLLSITALIVVLLSGRYFFRAKNRK